MGSAVRAESSKFVLETQITLRILLQLSFCLCGRRQHNFSSLRHLNNYVERCGNGLSGGCAMPCRVFAQGELPASIVNALTELTAAAQTEMNELESRRKDLNVARAEVTRTIQNKRKRDVRLMEKCGKNLSPEAMLQLAATKVAARAKAQAKAKARARSNT